MSFDLHFVPRQGHPFPGVDALAAWVKGREQTGFLVNEKGHISYQSPSTGVYFTLSRNSTSLDLNLNYVRPTFFALETFAVLKDLVRDFALLVNDPQADQQNHEYNELSLIEGWKEGNRLACSAFRDLGKNVLFLEEAKATELWQYLRVYPELKEVLDFVFVPQPVVIQNQGKLYRAAHLPQPTCYLVPPVDVFWLKDRSIVPVAEVLGFLSPFLTPLPKTKWLKYVDEDAYFNPELTDIWAAKYESLSCDLKVNQFTGAKLDGFVDVAS